MPNLPHTLTETLPSGTSFKMVLVEGGTFMMGSENGRDNEKPVHEVKLESFYLGQTQVTQELWKAVMGQDPETLAFPHPQRPVERVSWYDSVAFCNELSKKQGFRPAYAIYEDRKDSGNQNSFDDQKWTVTLIDDADGYRLPTEAEWEYAARGGPTWRNHLVEYAGSPNQNEIAWWGTTSHDISQPVALRPPNPLGLFDMSGNVWEWCWDWFGLEYYQTFSNQKAVEGPIGPESGEYRVVRGGSWDSDDDNLRVAFRYGLSPFNRIDDYGLRLCRYPM